MKAIKSVFLLSLVTTVTPGNIHVRIRNETVPAVNGSCSLSDYATEARCARTDYRLICRGGFTSSWVNGIKQEITHLRILEWPGECFAVGNLQYHFPELRHFELINSTALKTFKGYFDSTCLIEKITMHGLSSLWELPPEVVVRMQRLREMDLRKNVIRHMKAEVLVGPPKLERVHLSGNSWDCSDGGLDWLAMEEHNSTVKLRIIDYNDLVCHQQLYRAKPLPKVMDIIKSMRETCPQPCTCVMTYVVSNAAGVVIPLITVNCSNIGLLEPPESLPPGTTTLRLEGNKIENIRAIVHHPQYKRLADLYLDNNSISTVKELEGTEWFSTFRVLSLRGNKLKQIPVYAFDKAFKINNNIMHVFLGHNPWRCDCNYIQRFQTLLLKYKRVIRDHTDIRCSMSDDKKTSLVQVSTIALGNICISDTEMSMSPVNIVNLLLLALILLIVGKFLYDLHSFKTTGKLPWLSTILP